MNKCIRILVVVMVVFLCTSCTSLLSIIFSKSEPYILEIPDITEPFIDSVEYDVKKVNWIFRKMFVITGNIEGDAFIEIETAPGYCTRIPLSGDINETIRLKMYSPFKFRIKYIPLTKVKKGNLSIEY